MGSARQDYMSDELIDPALAKTSAIGGVVPAD